MLTVQLKEVKSEYIKAYNQAKKSYNRFLKYIDRLKKHTNIFNIDNLKYIGHSSSFYYIHENQYQDFLDYYSYSNFFGYDYIFTLNRNDYNYDNFINDIKKYIFDNYSDSMNDSEIELEIIELLKEEIEVLKDIGESITIESFKKDFSDTIKLYKYIRDFKRNQVDYFLDWLDWYENNILEFNE